MFNKEHGSHAEMLCNMCMIYITKTPDDFF